MPATDLVPGHALSQPLSHKTDICHRSNSKTDGAAPGTGRQPPRRLPPALVSQRVTALTNGCSSTAGRRVDAQ